MSGATEYVELTTSAYSALSSGQATVRVVRAAEQKVRLVLGTSQPSASTNDWYPLGEEEEQFENLDANTIVYARGDGGPASVRVMRI